MPKNVHFLSAAAATIGIAAAMSFPQQAQAASIVETASSAGSFNTLVTALEATGLDDTLNGDGPFTVFAPTDEAFAALPDGLLESLLRNPSVLTEILTYHVAAGSFDSTAVVGLDTVSTVQGSSADIAVEGDTVQIDTASVTAVDIAADNGIIHVIDSVILPENITLPPVELGAREITRRTPTTIGLEWGAIDGADRYKVRVLNENGDLVMNRMVAQPSVLLRGLRPSTEYTIRVRAENDGGVSPYKNRKITTKRAMTIVERAEAIGGFSTLIAALEATGLDETLNGDGPFTVFAPTDEAFAALPEGTLESLLADPEALSNILLYHVIPGERVQATDFRSIGTFESAQGSHLRAGDGVNARFDVEGVDMIVENVKAGNGMIHAIDSVLLP